MATLSYSSTNAEWSYRVIMSSTQSAKDNATTSISLQVLAYYDKSGIAATYNVNFSNIIFNINSLGVSLPNKSFTEFSANTWVSLGRTTFYTTIPHDSFGKASIRLLFNLESNRGSCNEVRIVSLPTIPKPVYMTSAPNFTENDFDKGLTIKFANPNGTTTNIQACISLTGATDNIRYRPTNSNSSYTFNLTPAERTTLINAITKGNSISVRFYVKGVLEGATYWSYFTRTFTLADCMPHIEPTVVDVNEKTLALTGNPNKLVKYASHAKCVMNATAKQGATIKLYEIANGAAKESTSETVLLGPESAITRFTATDSRGNSEVEEVISPFVEYIKPTCNYKVELALAQNQNPGDESKMKVSFELTGQWFSGNFGKADNVFSIWMRQSQGSKIDDAVEWTEITILSEVSRGENTYKANFWSDGFDYDKSYTFQFMIRDSISEFQTAPYTATLYPVFDWSETDFNFNVPVKIKGDLVVSGNITSNGGGSGSGGDYIVEQGTASMGSNGTWYWEKWNSGKAVCYGCRNFGNMAVSTAWGSGYFGAYLSQDFPEDLFSETPTFLDITIRNTDSGYAWIARSGKPTEAATGDFTVVRFSSGNISQVYIAFHAIGKWK